MTAAGGFSLNVCGYRQDSAFDIKSIFRINLPIGAFIADSWHLPDTVCSVIMNHHEPSETPVSIVTTYIVNAADLIANINGYGLRLEEETDIFAAESVEFLNLDADQMNLAWQSIQYSLTEVVAVFS